MHKKRYYLIPFLFLLGLATAAQGLLNEEELLLPDQAFQISGQAGDDDRLVVEWRIADGYYMYRDKIRFETDSMGFELGSPTLSDAKIKHDEFFGDVVVYYQNVTAQVPVQHLTGKAGEITLQIGHQGCAEAGICYPPAKKTIPVALAAATAIVSPAAAATPATGSGEDAGDVSIT